MKYLNNILKNRRFETRQLISVGNSYGFLFLFLMSVFVGYAQEVDPQLSESNDYVFEGNSIVEEDFIEAEKKYRLAVSTKENNATGSFNLGNAYYNSELYDEALLRHLEAVENSSSKTEKHKAYHNIGNILMQKKQCKEAVSAFKNALRNNPSDDESRYNLALAQECAKSKATAMGRVTTRTKIKIRTKTKTRKTTARKKKIRTKRIKTKGTKTKIKTKETIRKMKTGNPKTIREIRKIKTLKMTRVNRNSSLENCHHNK